MRITIFPKVSRSFPGALLFYLRPIIHPTPPAVASLQPVGNPIRSSTPLAFDLLLDHRDEPVIRFLVIQFRQPPVEQRDAIDEVEVTLPLLREQLVVALGGQLG